MSVLQQIPGILFHGIVIGALILSLRAQMYPLPSGYTDRNAYSLDVYTNRFWSAIVFGVAWSFLLLAHVHLISGMVGMNEATAIQSEGIWRGVEIFGRLLQLSSVYLVVLTFLAGYRRLRWARGNREWDGAAKSVAKDLLLKGNGKRRYNTALYLFLVGTALSILAVVVSQ